MKFSIMHFDFRWYYVIK